MLKPQKKPDSEGFTIIEVMIVLAIAGLIILIVLLAVPALQRNGRNTAIKNDASAVAAGVTEFASNNDGALPTAANSSQSGSSVNFNNVASGGTPSTAKVQSSTVVNFESTATPTASKYDVGNIDVVFKYKCGSSGASITPSPRSTAVLYSVETSSGKSPQCIDS